MNALPNRLLVAAMIVLPGCSAERVLAIASAPREANGGPGDVGGSPIDERSPGQRS